MIERTEEVLEQIRCAVQDVIDKELTKNSGARILDLLWACNHCLDSIKSERKNLTQTFHERLLRVFVSDNDTRLTQKTNHPAELYSRHEYAESVREEIWDCHLQDIVEKGWLKGTRMGNPAYKEYHITDAGRQAYEAMKDTGEVV